MYQKMYQKHNCFFMQNQNNSANKTCKKTHYYATKGLKILPNFRMKKHPLKHRFLPLKFDPNFDPRNVPKNVPKTDFIQLRGG